MIDYPGNQGNIIQILILALIVVVLLFIRERYHAQIRSTWIMGNNITTGK